VQRSATRTCDVLSFASEAENRGQQRPTSIQNSSGHVPAVGSRKAQERCKPPILLLYLECIQAREGRRQQGEPAHGLPRKDFR
jgi:hypothetical protein